MPPPLFSVVIPTINRVEPLRITIESILAQECGDLECVLVDTTRMIGLTDFAKVLAMRVCAA